MSITLYHHPYSRAANTVWMLEEAGAPYKLHFLDLFKAGHKAPEILALNPMGKLPIITDGKTVVTEAAAIGLYLADKYAYGRLAPKVDDPQRGPYLRWSFFSPSVIEPAAMAKHANWEVKESSAGWGTYDSMMTAAGSALSQGDWVLGNTFSMADVIFGGTLRFMVRFKTITPTAEITAYISRLEARPALQRCNEINARVCMENGLKAH